VITNLESIFLQCVVSKLESRRELYNIPKYWCRNNLSY